MSHVASVWTPCCLSMGVVVQSLIPVILLAPSVQTDATLLRNNFVGRCYVRLHQRSFRDSLLQFFLSVLITTFTIYISPIIHLVCPPKILHNLCFLFLLGITVVPREIKDNAYVKFGGGGGGGQTRCIIGDVQMAN